MSSSSTVDPGGEFGSEFTPAVVTTCKVAWE
jgi:hypothetical protein